MSGGNMGMQQMGGGFSQPYQIGGMQRGGGGMRPGGFGGGGSSGGFGGGFGGFRPMYQNFQMPQFGGFRQFNPQFGGMSQFGGMPQFGGFGGFGGFQQPPMSFQQQPVYFGAPPMGGNQPTEGVGVPISTTPSDRDTITAPNYGIASPFGGWEQQ